MAAECFVDASGWFALVVPRDLGHAPVAAAVRTLVSRRIRLVTTNLVVAETHALILRRVGRPAALTFVRTVTHPPNLVVRSTADLEAVAVRDWLERYADQDFSFADAVSFAVMAARGIEEALTLDRHFAAAGFRMVGGEP